MKNAKIVDDVRKCPVKGSGMQEEELGKASQEGVGRMMMTAQLWVQPLLLPSSRPVSTSPSTTASSVGKQAWHPRLAMASLVHLEFPREVHASCGSMRSAPNHGTYSSISLSISPQQAKIHTLRILDDLMALVVRQAVLEEVCRCVSRRAWPDASRDHSMTDRRLGPPKWWGGWQVAVQASGMAFPARDRHQHPTL